MIIHELGHLSAAVLMGYSWNEFQVGPTAIVRRGTEFHLVYSKKWVSGRVFVEWKPTPYSTRRAVFVYAAGPLANLCFSIFLFFFFSMLSPANQDAYWPLIMTSVLSFWLFLTNLVPFANKRAGIKSDGLCVLENLRYSIKNNGRQV
jgi:hypothetical protein